MTTTKSLCTANGHFPFEDNVCTSTFLKCSRSLESKKLEGHLYRCPSGYIYWQVSRRCEKSTKVPDCKGASTRQRLGIPVEWSNLGRRRSLRF